MRRGATTYTLRRLVARICHSDRSFGFGGYGRIQFGLLLRLDDLDGCHLHQEHVGDVGSYQLLVPACLYERVHQIAIANEISIPGTAFESQYYPELLRRLVGPEDCGVVYVAG